MFSFLWTSTKKVILKFTLDADGAKLFSTLKKVCLLSERVIEFFRKSEIIIDNMA